MTAETHPQRAQIVEKLMDTSRRWSTRQIAATLTPPLNHATIARFRAKLLGHATETMRGVDPKYLALKDLAAVSNGTGSTADEREGVKSRIRDELQRTIAGEASKIDRWRADAEQAQYVHPLTGEVSHNMDHGSLAKHTRNKLSALEMSAKLYGVMQDTGTGGATIRAVVMMPTPADPAAGQPAEPGRVAVELDLKR